MTRPQHAKMAGAEPDHPDDARPSHDPGRIVAALCRLARGVRLLSSRRCSAGASASTATASISPSCNRLHGWPTSLIASATTVFYLVTAALVVFISDAIARLGPRRVMLIGAVLLRGRGGAARRHHRAVAALSPPI